MSIQGKKEGIFRLLGSFLILISLILSIILDYFILNNPLLYLFIVLIVIPPFILSILLKLERDFIVNNSSKLLLLLVIESIILSVLIFAFIDTFLVIKFVMTVSSSLLLISSWHFSLSLYKKNKFIFVIGGFGYFILNILLGLEIFNLDTIFIFNLFPLVFILLGLLLIIVAELIMKKKGLLNYI